MKFALESGVVNLHKYFGNGLLYRGILRWQSQLKFSRSHLEIKSRFSPEYYDVTNTIKSIGYQANIRFIKFFNYNFLQLDGALNHQTGAIKSYGEQSYEEWQMSAFWDQYVSKFFQLETGNEYISRRIETDSVIKFNRNKILLLLTLQNVVPGVIKSGPFWATIHLGEADTTDSKQQYGWKLQYQFNKFLILNMYYQFGVYLKDNAREHQLSIVAGKYLSKKMSVLLSAFYTWINDKHKNMSLFNRAEIFNNINFKLGYDFSEKINIYLKAEYEDHKLINNRQQISSKQVLLGIQHKL